MALPLVEHSGALCVLSNHFAIACINALTAFLLRVLLAARYKGKIKKGAFYFVLL